MGLGRGEGAGAYVAVWFGGLGLLSCVGAGSSVAPPEGVERPATSRAPEAPTALRLSAPEAAAILARGGPTPVDERVVAGLAGATAAPLRLVSRSGEHHVLERLVVEARRLRSRGGDPVLLEPSRLAAARATAHRLRADGEGGAPLEEALREVETLGWRLAHGLARELGGPLAEVSPPGRLARRVLGDPEGWLRELTPQDPAYPVLVEALERYRTLAARSRESAPGRAEIRGWRRLRPGVREPSVVRLRERLESLGFPSPLGGDPKHFGPDLRAAVEAFQRRHGLVADGLPGERTLAALAVPLAERVAQLESALRHLRRTPARLHPNRVQVNIPAFRLQLFVHDRVVAHHRVVVGRRGPTEGQGYPNRTPTLSSRITDLILNPAWHVPRRIKEQVLDVRARRGSRVYEGFELHVDGQGVERAVQPPGPGNALGRVKFLFAGGDGVYLHDTPKPAVFERVRRDLSHGCVRVDDALDLARRILEVDRHPLGLDRADRIIRSGRRVRVTLERPLPIFLEYVTVGVDRDGEVRFFEDLYGWGAVASGG